MIGSAKTVVVGALERARVVLLSACSLLALGSFAAAADLAPTADQLPTKKAPPPVAAAPSPFFVKFGFTYAVNTSTSKIYAEGGSFPSTPGSPQVLMPGVGANIANVETLGFEAGYFVTPNVSVDVSAGVPMWAKVTTKGTPGAYFSAIPPNDTKLSSIMPSFVPVTALYHFTQFGAFQPYLGAGVAPVFSFSVKNGFNTGVSVDPTVGLVLQAGADVMVDQHWGWSFDVKKLYAQGESHSTGDNFYAIGIPAPAAYTAYTSKLKTTFEPWILATGVTYRF